MKKLVAAVALGLVVLVYGVAQAEENNRTVSVCKAEGYVFLTIEDITIMVLDKGPLRLFQPEAGIIELDTGKIPKCEQKKSHKDSPKAAPLGVPFLLFLSIF